MAGRKTDNLVEITARIVAAYVENNPISTAALTVSIASVGEVIGKLYDAPHPPRR